MSKLLENTIKVCEMVVARAEETDNCGICGEDIHAADCPYPIAKQVVMGIANAKQEKKKGRS